MCQRAHHHGIESGIAYQPLGDLERVDVVAADRNGEPFRLMIAIVRERCGGDAIECAHDALVVQKVGCGNARALLLRLHRHHPVAALAWVAGVQDHLSSELSLQVRADLRRYLRSDGVAIDACMAP